MTESEQAAPTAAGALRGRRAIRLALAFILGAKLALMALGDAPLIEIARAATPGQGSSAASASATGTKVATAAEPKTAPGGSPKTDVRGLLESLERRQSELDARELEVKTKEERLALYEKDVTAKVASLEEIEKRLSARAKAATQAVDAAAESLAKIYGTMKPESAAPILDKLDDSTVLTIFRRMKEKQVAEILPLMTRERAITLTQALADRQ
jgi:flagellar motility protein MotE (MotC chaperone)